MNVQLGHVLSDLSGVSGINLIQAILEGERDRQAWAPLVMPGVKAPPGRYRPESFQKPCIADSRSLGNNQLKAKLLRPFGQRSDLLLAISGFIVFGSFVGSEREFGEGVD